MDDADQVKVITEANHVIRIQLAQMMHCLDADQIMDALKAASAMLAELRTNALSPKAYYDLYVPVFDALRHLSAYLLDAHLEGRHHLADLYELVQYCGSVVPRLYLMITVGSVYMSIDDAPTKEVMRDMMEMSRGVQHPTRGLFLRNYLSSVTRDHLPTGDSLGREGNLQDSIGFVLTNFIEMNKLWVRLQHQGPSREREKRETERRELRILIGTNLVRLSELEGVGLDLYRQVILPSILEQVINCKDVIAQEYLMEVVIQIFPDHFHIYSLGPFLQACSLLHPKVNIKNIVIALINRIAAYAQRESENDGEEHVKRQEQLVSERLLEKARKLRLQARQGHPTSESVWEQVRQADSPADDREANSALSTIMGNAPASTPEQPAPTAIPAQYGSARPNIATHGGGYEEDNAWAEPVAATLAPPPEDESETAWASASDAATSTTAPVNGHIRSASTATDAGQEMNADFGQAAHQPPAATQPERAPEPVVQVPVEQLDTDEQVETFRGVPVNVPLFEVFWTQVADLIQARPDLSLPDITALLLALLQLSLACYPDRIEYVDQVLGSAAQRLEAHAQAGDPYLLAEETLTNFRKLLALPIETYTSTLILLALPQYKVLLDMQQYATRKHVSQAIVWSTLRHGTILSTPDDVDGILELCKTLVVAQRDAPSVMGPNRHAPHDGPLSPAELQIKKEQGWLARLIHQFQADSVDTQFALLQSARAHFVQGGDRIRYTLPVLAFAAVDLAKRFKLEENVAIAEDDQPEATQQDDDTLMPPSKPATGSAWSSWKNKMATLYKYTHQIIDLLYTRIESNTVSDLSLRLYLLGAQSADQSGFEDQAYDFFVQAFTVYQESISESRAQLQAIGLIISTLQTTRGFTEKNYDWLITKATLHGAKLLKKPHQATAVLMASHMWWQVDPPSISASPTLTPSAPSHDKAKAEQLEGDKKFRDEKKLKKDEKEKNDEKRGKETKDEPEMTSSSKDDAPISPHTSQQPLLRDGKRVLECLQKALRIANSCIDERSTVEIFCSALDQYLYYFEQGVEQIQPRFLTSLVELISAGIDALTTESTLDSSAGLADGANQAQDACLVQFRAQLLHMVNRQRLAQGALQQHKGKDSSVVQRPDWSGVTIQGALTKWGIA